MKKKIIATLVMSLLLILQLNTMIFAKPLNKASAEKPCVISCVGDSITYSLTYAAVLDVMPEITVKNYGVCASQVAGITESSFVNRTKNEKFKSDIILIFGGTNDYMGDKAMCNPLGMPDSTDIATYFGAYNTMIKNIKKNNPKAQIVLVTPIKRKGYENTNAYGYALKHYALATQMIAQANGLPCIDLYNNETCDFTGTDYLIDGLHPDINGHKILASAIYQNLMALQ